MRTFLLIAGLIALASIPVSWLVNRFVGSTQAGVTNLVASGILQAAVAIVAFGAAVAAGRHGGAWWAVAFVLGLIGAMSLCLIAVRIGVLWLLATGRVTEDEGGVRR